MNKVKAKQDLGLSVFIYALFGFFFYQTANLKAEDSKTFPFIILMLLLILNTLLFVKAVLELVRTKEPQREKGAAVLTRKDLLAPFLAFLGIVVYVVVYQHTNYFIATAIMMLSFLFILKVRPWWKVLVITLGYLLFIYILFVIWLHVRLL